MDSLRLEKLKKVLRESLALKMNGFRYPTSQAAINQAIWLSLTGKGTSDFEDLTRKWGTIPLPSQVYFYASIAAGKRVLKENVLFINSLNQKTNAENQAKDSEIAIADTVVGSVAAIVNVVPVVGQAISAVIAIGYALSRLVYAEGLRIELREGSAQIRQSFTGDGMAYKGILLSPSITKESIDDNQISQALDIDEPGSLFDYYVRMEDIENAIQDMEIT